MANPCSGRIGGAAQCRLAFTRGNVDVTDATQAIQISESGKFMNENSEKAASGVFEQTDVDVARSSSSPEVLVPEPMAFVDGDARTGDPLPPSGREIGPVARGGSQVGLALSGGGIRSTAFSIGVLQALHMNNAIKSIDFLSTVSGGGFAGMAMVAAMRRDDGKFPFDLPSTNREACGPGDTPDHERRSSDYRRYLMPNGWHDLFQIAILLLRAIGGHAVVVSSAVFFCAALTLFFHPTADSLWRPWQSRFPECFEWLLGLVVVSLLFLAFKRSIDWSRNNPGFWPALVMAILVMAIFVVFVAAPQVPILRVVLERIGPKEFEPSWTLLPNALLIFFCLAMVAAAVMACCLWLQNRMNERAGTVAKYNRRLVALACVMPLLFYAGYLWMTAIGMRLSDDVRSTWVNSSKEVLSLGMAVAVASIGLLRWKAKVGPVPETLISRIRRRPGVRCEKPSLWVVAGVVLIVIALSLPILQGPWLQGAWLQRFTMGIIYLAIAVCLTFISILFTENTNSLHWFYRNRLNQAFDLGHSEERVLLSELSSPLPSGGSRRPFPIINATVNLQGSETKRHGRDADFFVFTPEYVGSDATGYVPTAEFERAEQKLDIAAAVAISAAAVSSAMGRVGVRVLAPTLALFNMRLGYWVRNPSRLDGKVEAESAREQDWRLSYLLYEMLGLLDEKKSKVLLSDGGHLDNLGLFQLLKRRCDLIIVSDAEDDPGMKFGSMVDVQHFALEDLNVELDLPWQAIKEHALKRKEKLAAAPDSPYQSPSSSHAVIGKIFYPKTADRPGSPGQPKKEGILLYVKSSVTGDECCSILDYERRFPRFPHQATINQFFSQKQFEAYRALGLHAMDHALNNDGEDSRHRDLLDQLRAGIKVAI
ncbi:patatin-like phospholipase family protein [Sinorhizobium terangae]|uniref:patatin-like phospholipase family protein n=1 Tax=Sinorhizobium terangae TaxID=110322 RepID=UPI0024B24094|nr:patatin-like phospholipase family protein [Sinorhizobium terangae]WFU50719.1 patatin-like phospholipase family protein [Sinorhizobium terangae]